MKRRPVPLKKEPASSREDMWQIFLPALREGICSHSPVTVLRGTEIRKLSGLGSELMLIPGPTALLGLPRVTVGAYRGQ